MKKIFGLMMALAIAIGLSMPAHATLINRGTDTLGNQLIYDTDLNITWYDFTKSYDTWQNQVNWADALTVTFGTTTYDDWRLPTVFNQTGTGTCSGLNCTGSEMGHLFYTELGSSAGGPVSTSFTDGLTGNTESFQNLLAYEYWTGTVDSGDSNYAWAFDFGYGVQRTIGRVNTSYLYGGLNALAVRPGDVSTSVPEPATMILLGSGLAGIVVLRKRLGSREG